MYHTVTINKLPGVYDVKHVKFIKEAGLFLGNFVVDTISEVVWVVRNKAAIKRVTSYSRWIRQA